MSRIQQRVTKASGTAEMAPTTLKGPSPVLTLSGLSKTFQGQQALRNVSLELQRGEIHCLLGQNGSGKSTLIKALAGYHSPDPGCQATIFGEPVELGAHSPSAAGLRFIHQDLGLLDSLSVADNMSLAGGYAGRFWISDRRHIREAQAILDSYGVEVKASAMVAEIGVAARTLVAIVRALHYAPSESILVLDEPTAALAESDKRRLFELLHAVRARGQTVLYVTHHLQEVFELADRVTVLRNGRAITTCSVADLTPDSLVELIVGRKLGALYPEHDESQGAVVLEVEHLSGRSVRDLSLSVHEGEIVGIVGLMGGGAEDVPHLLFG